MKRLIIQIPKEAAVVDNEPERAVAAESATIAPASRPEVYRIEKFESFSELGIPGTQMPKTIQGIIENPVVVASPELLSDQYRPKASTFYLKAPNSLLLWAGPHFWSYGGWVDNSPGVRKILYPGIGFPNIYTFTPSSDPQIPQLTVEVYNAPEPPNNAIDVSWAPFNVTVRLYRLGMYIQEMSVEHSFTIYPGGIANTNTFGRLVAFVET